MQNKIQALCLLLLTPLLVQCGNGSSDSGASASPGATRFTGTWNLVATLNVNLGGTATFITDTSDVVVSVDGNVAVLRTDSECGLTISVNGDVMTYTTQCIFPVSSDSVSTQCTLTLTTRAKMRGVPGSANLFGSFGPETEVCRGVAASYTGNLVGNRNNSDDEEDADETTDDDEGEPGDGT